MKKSQHAVPIVRTKLYRPPVTADYVRRDRLEETLESGFALPLTVVSAPPGYGKSTLVSRWLETCDCTNAWLSLDEADSDIRVFLSYLVAAVRTVSAEACKETLKIVNSESLPPLPVIVAHLSNDLDELDERLALALDDYQRIHESGIHLILDHLLEHPSRHLHLIILSRRDPVLSLASLRARHLLNEIRMRDLEFTNEETLSFFGQLSNHTVDPTIINRLQDSTEGWAVGVRLAALALQHQDNIEGFLGHFRSESGPLQEYLLGEVLSGQPPVVRDCLLIASVLDRFNASLCEAVWDTDVGIKDKPISGKEFIDTLENSGLFCVPLDGLHDWFRFHHLFADMLKQQLEETRSKEEIAGLHQRASHWFAQSGYFEEAIQHALAGHDDEAAAAIVGYARHKLMNRDQWHRLERWLALFPHETVEQHPDLLLLRCWLDLSHWYRLDFLQRDLDLADALLEAQTNNVPDAGPLRAEVAAMRSALAYWTSNPSLAITLSEQALRDSSDGQEYVGSVALMMQGGAHQLRGEAREYDRLLRDAMEEKRFNSPGSQARLLQALCFTSWCDADMRMLLQAASRLLELSLEHELSWSHSFARYFLGLIHYDSNELSDAISQLEIITVEQYRYPIQNVTHCSILLSLSYEALGLPDRAREVADSVTKFTFERGNRMFSDLANAFQADIDLRQGRIARSNQWASTVEIGTLHTLHRFFSTELTFPKVMTAQDTPQSRQTAAKQLERLHEHLSRTHNRRLLIDVLGMKALLADVEGDADTAVAFLQDAILLGQPGRLIRPLADLGPGLVKLLNRLDLDQEGLQYVGTIISALRGPQATTNPQTENQPLLEALSQRELEILGLLAKNLSNKEIAEQLFVSTGTVKRHAHNIYGKLSVSSRRSAVSKAIGLGILKTS